MKPSELLLVALAACTAVDVVEILRKKRQDLQGLRITVSGEQDADPPWTFRRIHIHYALRGAGLTSEGVEQAIRLSEEKYCSVAATLRGVARSRTILRLRGSEGKNLLTFAIKKSILCV